MLGMLCAAASLAYLCRNSIGVAESTMRRELGLSEAAMSWVMSGFFLAYALGQVPAGWLAGRLGSRRAIALFAAFWGVATAGMSLLAALPWLVLVRMANGAAQAGLFPACAASLGQWFPWSRRAVASGALASCMSLGGAAGVAATGVLLVQIGWRGTFILYGALSVLFAAGFWWMFRDRPQEHPWTNPLELALIESQPKVDPPGADTSLGLAMVLLSPPVWWICGQQFCRAAGQIFFSSWFATYLQETREVSVEQSGLLNSLPLIGIVAGSLAGGGLSDIVLQWSGSKRLARSGVAAVTMAGCAAFVFVAYSIQDPWLAVATISLGTFCAAMGGPCAYAVTIDMGGRHVAILFATMNMVGNLGAFAFIRATPEITRAVGWHAVLGVFGVLYLAAAAFWLLINPNRTVAEQVRRFATPGDTDA